MLCFDAIRKFGWSNPGRSRVSVKRRAAGERSDSVVRIVTAVLKRLSDSAADSIDLPYPVFAHLQVQHIVLDSESRSVPGPLALAGSVTEPQAGSLESRA